jgi:AcrR family transcriptional regulator
MPRTVAPEGTDRREEIVRAALEVFTERDFAEATTKAIAEKAGVTQGLIYFYFPGGKEELFRAAFEQEAQRALAGLDFMHELEAGTPPRTAIWNMVTRLLDVMEGPVGGELVRVAIKAQMCAWRPGDPYAERYRPMRALGEPISQALRDYLADQITRGSIRQLDPELTAHLMTSALLITLLRRGQTEGPLAMVSRQVLVDAVTNLFLYGLYPRADASAPHADG